MAFSLKSAASMKAGVAAGRVSRKNCVAVRAGKFDEELIKTAVRKGGPGVRWLACLLLHQCLSCEIRCSSARLSRVPVQPGGGIAACLPTCCIIMRVCAMDGDRSRRVFGVPCP
eukprot:597578-Pelagomonas_calceolata.AAC.1